MFAIYGGTSREKKKRKKKFTIVRFDTDFNFSFLVARKTETDIVNNYVRAEISSSENEIEIWNAKSKSKKWW